MSPYRAALAFSVLLLALPSHTLHAQSTKSNQLGFVIGAEFLPSNSLTPAFAGTANASIQQTTSLSLELNYGRKLHDFHYVSLWLDVPALVGPNHRISNGNPFLPTSNATFYVTPSARVAFRARGPITPWLSAGLGYGLFETSDAFAGGSANPTIHTNTGVAQFGGGVDVATPLHLLAFPIGLRGEVRDFYVLNYPNVPVPVTSNTQNSITVSGGAYIRF